MRDALHWCIFLMCSLFWGMSLNIVLKLYTGHKSGVPSFLLLKIIYISLKKIMKLIKSYLRNRIEFHSILSFPAWIIIFVSLILGVCHTLCSTFGPWQVERYERKKLEQLNHFITATDACESSSFTVLPTSSIQKTWVSPLVKSCDWLKNNTCRLFLFAPLVFEHSKFSPQLWQLNMFFPSPSNETEILM